MDKSVYKTFKTGSTTYFYSSIFFPAEIREDVFVLYNFVRKADNFVDDIPQQPDAFYAYWDAYRRALKGEPPGDIVFESIVELIHRRAFDPAWIEAFMESMEMDLTKHVYETMEETKKYMFGSAEVIGLMMSKIMGLAKESYPYAQMLGRSMQYINFIRDIDEDRGFGRVYLPLKDAGITSFDYAYIQREEQSFNAYIREQIAQYHQWQTTAEKGFAYIPSRYLIPIKTASDMYKWTAKKIYQDPLVVYRKKVKPKLSRILYHVLLNSMQAKRIGL